ncbi:5842_t:CDS:10, partial [Racocetra fulgida]
MADKENEDLQMAIDMSKSTSYPEPKDNYNDSRAVVLYSGNKDDWGNVEGYWKGQKHYYTNDDKSKLYSNANRQESLKCDQLVDVLDFDEKAIWNEAEVVSSFTNKLIAKLLEGSNYRDRVSGDQDIPAELQPYILDFEKYNSDGNPSFPTFQGDSTFQVLKELYMDRYMYENSQFVERCWQKIEIMKNELEKIDLNIDKIIKFQHFQQKCKKAAENGTTDDDAQRTKTWLEGVLDKVEQKLNDLLKKKDELEQNIKQIFDIPDMKKYHYRLKAVLVHNGQSGQGNHWAYIWVSRCSKSDNRIPNTMDDGNWMKFQDNSVEEAIENTVLNEPGIYHSSHSVYTLFYVNAQFDYNFSNLEEVIPDTLKAFVEKDNQILEEEIGNQIRRAELADNNNAMEGTWESDSTACGGSSDSEKIQGRIDTIKDQAKYLKIHDARILKSDIVAAFDDFKEIAQYIVEGLDHMIKKREFVQAIRYFYKAIQLENSWMRKMSTSILNDEALEHAKKDGLFKQAIEEATFVLKTFIAFDKTCGSDVLFNEFLQQWVQVQTHADKTDKMRENIISELVNEYCLVIDIDYKDDLNIPFDDVEDIPLDNEDTLFERYSQLTWK